jgi:hypothetical protein
MNKEKINQIFFEDIHNKQMSSIDESIIKDARKVILKLILYMNYEDTFTTDKGMNTEKDEAILDALKWIKNNQS